MSPLISTCTKLLWHLRLQEMLLATKGQGCCQDDRFDSCNTELAITIVILTYINSPTYICKQSGHLYISANSLHPASTFALRMIDMITTHLRCIWNMLTMQSRVSTTFCSINANYFYTCMHCLYVSKKMSSTYVVF